ncbi:MAG: hypothetical protein A2X29_03780 [Elusimicrobia bacterium GWA2_64_40]|nr:MAG: hypothetical protein A2X29_03780 [Elusimicrobia bacterium GWA2_64_40]
MKDLVCKICTIRLVEAAYARAPWFRLVRWPLRLGMLLLGRLYGADTGAYTVRSPACRGCPRLVKLELKEKSALFRLLNSLVNPYFDRLLERLLTERERAEARSYAERAVRGETEDGGHDEKHL